MGPVRAIVLVMSAAAVAFLCVPGTALAGTYIWNLSSDFTTVPPGANPDHDQYGARVWSYVTQPAPNTFALLPNFATNIHGALAGWWSAGNPPLVAINATGAQVTTSDPATIPAGQIAMQPSSSEPAIVAWTSPLSHATGVSVSGTVASASTGLCLSGGVTWSLEQGGSPIAGNSGTVTQGGHATISASPSVSPGGTIYLDVAPPPTLGSPSCSTAAITLQIQATATAPAVTLTSPASGAVLGGGQPSFSGAAANGFGDSQKVTVRVYRGSAATGTPVQVLSASRSGSAYSVTPRSALPDGRYTAQSEQDDLVGDHGFSAARTFQLKLHPPALTLGQPAAGATVSQSNELFSGAAGDAAGDSNLVRLQLYAGSSATGRPLRTIGVTAGGPRWSKRWPQSLAPRLYTLRATQSDDAGHTTVAGPHTFQVVRGPNEIGAGVALGRNGVFSVPITCVSSTGTSCTGTVLVLTTRSFQPVAGGPAGQLLLLFAHVRIPAGRTLSVHGSVSRAVARTLRRAGTVKLRLSADLSGAGGSSSVTRQLRLR